MNTLSNLAHQPRKRFGQNFLKDLEVIHTIVAAIAPKNTDHFVEIGPGQGALTSYLYKIVAHFDMIELDRNLIPVLEKKFKVSDKVSIHQADALTFNFSQLKTNNSLLRICGNLPYNISTPLIFHLLNYKNDIEDMHFMLQKEVVLRICAQPKENNYGRLSVMTQYYCDVSYLFSVPPNAFSPQPKVDSAIVKLKPFKKSPYQCNNIKNLKDVVRQAFSQRRKMIRNTLKDYFTAAQFKSLNIDPTLRAESLSVAHYVKLANTLN